MWHTNACATISRTVALFSRIVLTARRIQPALSGSLVMVYAMTTCENDAFSFRVVRTDPCDYNTDQ